MGTHPIFESDFDCLTARMSDELDQADADYTAKKTSYDNLPTFKRDMKEKYDQAFLGILQSEERIEPFVDAVMSFLYRKTDFYRTLTEESKVGFPPGVPENMLRCYFSKYNQKAKKDERDSERAEIEPTPPKSTPQQKVKVQKKTEPSPLMAKTQDEWQQQPDSHNGAVRDKYAWNQNFEDVDIAIPTTVATSKLVTVTMKHKSLKVKLGDEVIIDDALQHPIKADDSTWSLEKGKQLMISLTKATEIWLSKLVIGEDEIDMKKIKPERSIGDMPDDEVSVINRLQFDEMQKQLGKAQSHELKVHDMLKQGWDAEGSPFKGQEFDPKMFDIQKNAVQM